MKIETIISVKQDTDNLIIKDVPVSSTIADIPGYGLVIVDTGSPDNPDLLDELDQLGHNPADFKLVINTHLHVDHMGGNRLFTNARILISRREFEFETNFDRIIRESDDPLAALNAMGRYVNEETHELGRHLIRLVNQYPAADLVGDPHQIEFFEDQPVMPGMISLLQAPGHSIDSRVVLIKGESRRVTVAGDALYHRDLWRNDTLAAIHVNVRQFQQNAEMIASFPDIIVPGHDQVFDNRTGQYLPDNIFVI